MWTHGKINGCEYWVKHYSEPSVYGINEGKVSKLSVKRNDREIISYERGWDLEPQTDEDRAVLAAILEKYN